MKQLVLLFFSFFAIKNGAAQTQFDPKSVKIESMNYAEFQARYFDIQSDSTIIINIWASWCRPCRAEMPHFERLRKEFLNKKVKIVLVSIDKLEHVATKAIPFLILNEIGIEAITVQDKISPKTWIPLICPDWSGSIPLTIVVNKDDGKVFETSFSNYEQLKSAVIPYIKN